MSATVILCILSTLIFCLCARGILWLAPLGRRPVFLYGNRKFSARAVRFTLSYVKFALFVVAVVSLFEAVQSFIELFSLV